MSSLADIVGGDRDKIMLCPMRAIKKYLARTVQFRHACFSLFVMT